jgi:DNA transformation protein and related proteins
MDAEGIREVFEPFGRITLRRMFGGHGIYLEGLIIALEFDGVLFLKTDGINRRLFEGRGSRCFTYMKLGNETPLPNYWSLPASAFDDEDELRELTRSSLQASERAQAAKAKPKKRRPTAASGSRRP